MFPMNTYTKIGCFVRKTLIGKPKHTKELILEWQQNQQKSQEHAQ